MNKVAFWIIDADVCLVIYIGSGVPFILATYFSKKCVVWGLILLLALGNVKLADILNWRKIYACYLYVCLLGKLVKKGFGLNELLNIYNSAKVVNVKEPEAGTWTVKVLLFHEVCLCFIFVLACFIKYIQ
jgi:hypothetical protein